MKIVNREQFLKMPAGTLFSKYTHCIFEELLIKGETLRNINKTDDFYYQQIQGAIDLDQYNNLCIGRINITNSFDMDFYCQSRDGQYDENELYAIWNEVDVQQLIARLQQVLIQGYSKKMNN